MQLTNKIAFVSGGASGIGAACAKTLVEKGAKVVVADIDETKGTDLAENLNKEYGKGKAIFVTCDITKADNFKAAFQSAISTFNQVDIILNNAGVLNEHQWENVLNVNLKGTIIGTEIALAHMRKDKGGKGGVIINVASAVGYTPVFCFPVYAASKYGVLGYTRSMASAPDLANLGVRYACICPQVVDTPIFDGFKSTTAREDYYEIAQQIISQDRVSPNTVAEGLLSLITDDDSNDTLLEINAKQGLVRKKITVEDA